MKKRLTKICRKIYLKKKKNTKEAKGKESFHTNRIES
jgi:hypothetical protein